MRNMLLEEKRNRRIYLISTLGRKEIGFSILPSIPEKKRNGSLESVKGGRLTS